MVFQVLAFAVDARARALIGWLRSDSPRNSFRYLSLNAPVDIAEMAAHRLAPHGTLRRSDDPTGTGPYTPPGPFPRGEPLARKTILAQHCIRAATIRCIAGRVIPVYRGRHRPGGYMTSLFDRIPRNRGTVQSAAGRMGKSDWMYNHLVLLRKTPEARRSYPWFRKRISIISYR
jgi:hypothetical protein